MSIELTTEQSQAVAARGEAFVVIDPRTKQAYRLVREEVFRKIQALLYDDSPWTGDEKAYWPEPCSRNWTTKTTATTSVIPNEF